MTLHLAVLGAPIAHSLSPVVHNAAYQFLHWDADYTAIETAEADMADRVGQLRTDPTWRGFSLTMPLKYTIVPFLDHMGETAKLTGAVNTVVSTDGKLYGDNTDVHGIVRAFGKRGIGQDGLVLGSGATAKSALFALSEMAIPNVTIAARNQARAAAAIAPFKAQFKNVHVVTLDELNHLGHIDIAVSTLPAHVADSRAQLLAEKCRNATVLDVAYSPWPSALATQLESAGAKVISGLHMLVHQAVAQVKLFAPEVFPNSALGFTELTRVMSAAVNLD